MWKTKFGKQKQKQYISTMKLLISIPGGSEWIVIAVIGIFGLLIYGLIKNRT